MRTRPCAHCCAPIGGVTAIPGTPLEEAPSRGYLVRDSPDYICVGCFAVFGFGDRLRQEAERFEAMLLEHHIDGDARMRMTLIAEILSMIADQAQGIT